MGTPNNQDMHVGGDLALFKEILSIKNVPHPVDWVYHWVIVYVPTKNNDKTNSRQRRRQKRDLSRRDTFWQHACCLSDCLLPLTEEEERQVRYQVSTKDPLSVSTKGYKPQSGTTDDNNIMKVSSKSTHQNVKFEDQIDPYLYDVDSQVDQTRTLQDSNDATLDNFFSRPLKIHEEEWATSTTLGFDIDPWSLYFENPRVINRIANYKLLRANLMVKVIINGNGFQYGRALVSYLPFDVLDNLSSNASLVRADLVQASQQPRIFLDPTTSTGGEMKLPFFNFTNYTDIVTTDWSNLGQLFFRSLNDLKHANGASDVVTISVFAWAVDVHMSVLTSNDPDQLTPQSGSEIDEANAKGIVSGPATAIAKAAQTMSTVPYIGPYATATSTMAAATAQMAKLFGYCRPPVTRNPEPYRPTTTSSLAVTNVPDNVEKLTIDDKQELSIDPRIAGLGGVDPMNIREIAKRESYLTTFTWAIGESPESLLWNSRIDPVIWAETAGPPDSIHLPACAMAALPFQYWTGTMKFRFQIVASSFHKGRLKFVYDPEFLASNEYNTNYIKIVDIAEEQDFTLEIGNGQQTTLLEHHYPGLDAVSNMYSNTVYSSKSVGNGVLGVYIVNELTTPNSTVNNDIEINVFVSMGDDFEVFVPDDFYMNYTFAAPQSGFESQSGTEIVPDGQNTTEPSAPQQSMTEELGPGTQDTSNVNRVFTGEAISSFRTLLKRYNLHSSIAATDSNVSWLHGRRPHFPLYRGSVPNAVDTTAAAAAYNYCNTVLLHWVATAFSGRRGGIRYKLIPGGANNLGDEMYVSRARFTPGGSNYSEGRLALQTYSSAKAGHVRAVREQSVLPADDKPFPMHLGGAIARNQVNGQLDFEMPYYSQFRFTPGKSADQSGGQTYEAAWDYRMIRMGNLTSVVDVYTAAAEDFQVYFWTGLPRIYYEPTVPA